MHKIFLILITFCLISSITKAEIISKLLVNGNKRVSVETIKVYGDIKIGKEYSEADVDKILKDLYETEFFESIDINLNNQVLTINVNEYPVINQLIIVGEKSTRYKEQIKNSIKTKKFFHKIIFS